MDSVSCETHKSSSNISELLLRFSKLCKLGSIGVSPIETQKPTNDSHTESSEDSGETKIYTQPLDETLVEDSVEFTILKLFDAVSALKSAYIQLQQAYIPYEPRKIQIADELMVSELDSVLRLEAKYVGDQRSKPPQPQSSEHEQLIEELQSTMRIKESEILRLRREVEELERKNAELKEKMKKRPAPEQHFSLVDGEWTPSVFLEVFRLASKSIHDFAKPLISLMKASGWDLDRAADSIEHSVIYTERCHKKFAFESYISHVMLDSTLVDCFKVDRFEGVMRFSDPFDALMEDPDSDFVRFCQSRYLIAVKSKMESSFFGNLDQREFIARGGHPRTPFYQAFVRMARWVWALQVMARSFIPKAQVFYAKRGSCFDEECMESVLNLAVDRAEKRLEVGLTVMPGFKIGCNVMRCRVYIHAR